MLKKVIKLKPEQYEKLYQGKVILSPDEMTNLKLDLNNFNLIINGVNILLKTEYTIEIFDKYLSKQDVSDMLSLDIIDSWQPEMYEKLLMAQTEMLYTINDIPLTVMSDEQEPVLSIDNLTIKTANNENIKVWGD